MAPRRGSSTPAAALLPAAMAGAGVKQEEEDSEELEPVRPGRGLMYTLVGLQGMPNWVIRGGLPSWIPFVVADMSLSVDERAMLLAAWFPGYISSQIPGAALIDRIGPKLVLGLSTTGVCGCFMLLPLIERAAGGGSHSLRVRLMASTLTLAGFFQGPLIPGQQVMLSPVGSCTNAHCLYSLVARTN